MLLSNPKQEKFAGLYIKYSDDRKWKEILEESGYSANKCYYSSLKNKPKVRARILELQHLAAGKEVLNLHERLKMLSNIARNDKEPSRTRITALSEIHKQSGDDVIKMNVDVEGESIIRYVDVALPKHRSLIEEENIEEDIDIKELTIDKLLNLDLE